jgi:hypothetical protein
MPAQLPGGERPLGGNLDSRLGGAVVKCAAEEGRLAAELAMLGGEAPAIQMPRLDAFDEEFGREPVAVLRGHRRRRLRFSTVLGAVLGAAIITALAWPWISADGRLRSEIEALMPAAGTRDAADEQINRLVREVDVLKKEVADLTEERQQAAERIASLEAAEQEPRELSPSAYWYSNLAALNYGMAAPPRPSIAPPPARRSATVRTEGRDGRRRESGGAPLSLEAPQ